jgi:hypothetical protein
MTTEISGQSSRAQALGIAAAGALAVTAYAALAVLQILWLNPRAAVPGLTLTEIGVEMAARGESFGGPYVIGALSIGPVIAVALLVLTGVRRAVSPRHVVALYLGLLALGVFVYFAASFGPGMALADTFSIGGADYSPWAAPLYLVSLGSVIALVAIAVQGAVRRRRAGFIES